MVREQSTSGYQLQFERHENFLAATVTGENNAQNVLAYMQDIVEECRREECFRVLIHECLEGPRLDSFEVFSIASEGAMQAHGVFSAVAYVDEGMGDMADFVETVAVNRGFPIKTFATVADAERWLRRQTGAADEKNLFEEHNSRNPYR